MEAMVWLVFYPPAAYRPLDQPRKHASRARRLS